ncbi:hypothetical protein A2U01_0108060, partial [Trifolium medium]|nr:hypothetical protein [Trifolium medium]
MEVCFGSWSPTWRWVLFLWHHCCCSIGGVSLALMAPVVKGGVEMAMG